MSFQDLSINPGLIKALEIEKITNPTEIQTKVIPVALQNRDLVAQSETGTGKTLAYLLPLYHKLNHTIKEMQAIILVPTHELAVQVLRQIERLSSNSGIELNALPVIGNVNIDRQILKLKEKPHIIVGSPGRILELIKKKKISAHTIKTIIIDEADKLMDKNNIEPVKAIIKATLKERQVMIYSASISKDTITVAKDIMKEPEILKGEEKFTIPGTIEHIYLIAEQRDKIEAARKLVRMLEPEKAIIFINQSEEVGKAEAKLNYHGLRAESIHGSNFKLDRKKTMEDFRTGKLQLLIASDIAARGLHIEGITHIINISIPQTENEYLHRAGRTGRNGNKGLVISIATEKEAALLKKYERCLNISIAYKEMYMGRLVDNRQSLRKQEN